MQQQRIRSCDVCVFLALIYVKAWFSSSQSIEAAQNDIQLIKNGILYSKIDSVSSEIILDKISNHLLYLGSETIGMSFFDVRVSVEEKRKMVAALNIQKNIAIESLSLRPRLKRVSHRKILVISCHRAHKTFSNVSIFVLIS